MSLGYLGQPPQLFGNRNRTLILVAIALLEETYLSELAALLKVRLFTVQNAVADLERESVLSTRQLGQTRLVRLNPRYFAATELRALLWKLGTADLALQESLASRRRRPRRMGKGDLG